MKEKYFPFHQKIFLVLFGIFACFLLVESTLRIAGFIYAYTQERKNLESIRNKGAFKILCLGESTTALGRDASYPSQLEDILNQRGIGIRFTVINNGVCGVNSSYIVRNLTNDLDKYNPDLVVVMMGINDGYWYLPYHDGNTSGIALFFTSLRTYKLIRWLWLNTAAILQKINIQTHSAYKDIYSKVAKTAHLMCEETYAAQEEPRKADRAFSQNPDTAEYRKCIILGRRLIEQNKLGQAQRAFEKALQLEPGSRDAIKALVMVCRDLGRLPEAEKSLLRAASLNPGDDNILFELGEVYKDEDKILEATQAYKQALKINPANDLALSSLTGLLQEQEKLAQTGALFKQALRLNPQNENALIGLAITDMKRGNLKEAEELLRKAVSLSHSNDKAFFELGQLYRKLGRAEDARSNYLKAVELNAINDKACSALGAIYLELGKTKEAARFYKQADTIRLKYCSPMTPQNFRKLKVIADSRAIRLVCVQYPTRNVEELKRMFDPIDRKDIIFVDNEIVFKKAFRADPREYFTDLFAGDFGHCTRKGNRLLAGNIANAILKDVFNVTSSNQEAR